MEMKEIKQYLRMAFAAAGHNFDDYNITVSVSNRIKKTLGWCEIKANGYKYYPTEIRFSNYMLENSELSAIKDVIYHEAAHALVAIETNENHGHDAVFRAMCKRIGTTNDGTVTKAFKVEEPDKFYKYTTYCTKCGAMTGGFSRTCNTIKYSHLYKSKCCGAAITVKQNW